MEQALARVTSEQEAQRYDLESKYGNMVFKTTKLGTLTNNYLSDIIAIGDDVKQLGARTAKIESYCVQLAQNSLSGGTAPDPRAHRLREGQQNTLEIKMDLLLDRLRQQQQNHQRLEQERAWRMDEEEEVEQKRREEELMRHSHQFFLGTTGRNAAQREPGAFANSAE